MNSMAIPFALWSALLGLTVAGFILGVRALPWVDRRVMALKKPWACDFCMCFWGTLLWGGLGYRWYVTDLGAHGWAVMGPAYPLALWFLGHIWEPPSMGPALMGEDDES